MDVVTSRQGNLHNDLMALLGLQADFRMPAEQRLYAVSYRPLSIAGSGQIAAWPNPLAVGQGLPTVPLSLEAEHCVPLDLEAAYSEACQRRRVADILS